MATKTGTSKTAKTSTAAGTVTSPAATNGYQPSHDEIAQRAFELFVQRGGAHGEHESDWLRAEAELKKKPATKAVTH